MGGPVPLPFSPSKAPVPVTSTYIAPNNIPALRRPIPSSSPVLNELFESIGMNSRGASTKQRLRPTLILKG